MIALTLAEIATAVGGVLELSAGVTEHDTVAGAVQTDSRLVNEGSIFFALRGETTDGHLFAAAAVDAGAALLIVERSLPLPVPQLVVSSR